MCVIVERGGGEERTYCRTLDNKSRVWVHVLL